MKAEARRTLIDTAAPPDVQVDTIATVAAETVIMLILSHTYGTLARCLAMYMARATLMN